MKAVREERVKLQGEGFVKEVGFKPRVKEIGSCGWTEWWNKRGRSDRWINSCRIVALIRAYNNIDWFMCDNYPRRLYSRRRGYSVQSRLSVSFCLFVRTLKGKRLELSTPNFVYVYSIAVARHALTQRSKGQAHTVRKPLRSPCC